VSLAAPLLVLHVCTGNICRSPMAELIMRAELDRTYAETAARVALDGGGTYGGHAGAPINPPAGAVLGDLGIDASGFRAQALTVRAVDHADLVVCAAREHVHRVVTMVPDAADRAFTLLDLARVAADHGSVLPTDDPVARLTALRELAASDAVPLGRASDIEDPYGLSAGVYEATAARILEAVRAHDGAGGGP
jgi:protein-tyrosine phosphatase